jgi:predicted nucleic acid-binding protein
MARRPAARVREPSARYAGARPVLVDSNILIDIFDLDPLWFEWSAERLDTLGAASALLIDPIIYAEVAAGFARIEDLELALAPYPLVRESLPWDAAFMAAQAHKIYRRRGGAKRSPMPDFYIGAHATIGGYTLLTRDPVRYREYFPRLRIVSPE